MLFTRIELAQGHGRTCKARLSKRRSVSRLYIHSVIRLAHGLLGGVRRPRSHHCGYQPGLAKPHAMKKLQRLPFCFLY